MISTLKLLTLTVFISRALACLEASIYIDDCPVYVGDCSKYASLTDNGDVKCGGKIGAIDQDGHYTMPCDPGFVWAFTQDLTHSWYGYGTVSFNWDQIVETGERDCGACNGKTGKCDKCSTRQVDTYEYC